MSVDPNSIPTTEQVASLLVARTKTIFGVEQPGAEALDFTDATRPTAAQATTHIEAASHEVYAEAGPFATMAESVQPLALQVIAYGAAMRIELAYFPDQARIDRNVYEQLERRYESMLKRLVAAAREAGTSGSPVAGADGGAQHSFDEGLGLLGFGTSW